MLKRELPQFDSRPWTSVPIADYDAEVVPAIFSCLSPDPTYDLPFFPSLENSIRPAKLPRILKEQSDEPIAPHRTGPLPPRLGGAAQPAEFHTAQPTVPSAPPVRKETRKERKARMNSVGDHRLKISFINFGVPGDSQQTVMFKGKGDAIIPDGLQGITEVYNEPWMFEIHHRKPDPLERTVLEFSVTNLNSHRTVTRTETVEEAMVRETQARTICNQVLKQAMELRAQEYGELLRQMSWENEQVVDSNVEGKIRILRPKRMLIGPLFFGLQHRIVQEEMNKILGQCLE